MEKGEGFQCHMDLDDAGNVVVKDDAGDNENVENNAEPKKLEKPNEPEIEVSNISKGPRFLFTPEFPSEDNILRVKKKGKNGELTKIHLCSARGCRLTYSYYPQSELLVVPIVSKQKEPGETGSFFLCCFVLSLDKDDLINATAYKNLREDYVNYIHPYVFVRVQSGNVEKLTPKQLKRVLKKVDCTYGDLENIWEDNPPKTKIFGYDD